MNEYGAFSLVYDSVMDEYDYDRVFHWIKTLFFEDKGLELLEMAMGTGRLTEKLLSLGTVDGFDLSPDMLARAEERLRGKGQVRLFRQDLRTFDMRRTYDGIFCLCDGLNYLLDKEELAEVFRRVAAHLRPGGLFVFDLNTDYRFGTVYGNRVEVREDGGFVLIWENHYQAPVNRYAITLFLEDEDGRYTRYDELHEERAYGPEEVKGLLEAAGLRLVRCLDGYSDRDRHEKTERAVYIVKK